MSETETPTIPTLDKLGAALAKAQGQMVAAKKDSANPFFKSSYADLASVWEAIRKPFSENGLSVIQTTEGDCDTITVVTTLLHLSGQKISGVLKMRPVKTDPQGIGSCITYARRYALAAIAGVAPEEDDGNAASGKGENIQPPKAPPPPPRTPPATSKSTEPITEPQRKRLWAMCKEARVNEEKLKDYLLNLYGYESSKDIKKSDYDAICDWVKKEDDIPFGLDDAVDMEMEHGK